MQTEEVTALLLDASGTERVHRDILVLSFGDLKQLRNYCALAKLDSRDVMIAEEHPEDFLDFESRPEAASELARRFESLGFEVPAHTSYWARHV